jgi:hypothetical protein
MLIRDFLVLEESPREGFAALEPDCFFLDRRFPGFRSQDFSTLEPLPSFPVSSNPGSYRLGVLTVKGFTIGVGPMAKLNGSVPDSP